MTENGSITATLKKVDCLNFNGEIVPGESILDHVDLERIIPYIDSVEVYRRALKDCPFGRGNWVVDITKKDGSLLCIKYPLELPEEELVSFVEPFIKMLKLFDLEADPEKH